MSLHKEISLENARAGAWMPGRARHDKPPPARTSSHYFLPSPGILAPSV
jgi:hypothetical protein